MTAVSGYRTSRSLPLEYALPDGIYEPEQQNRDKYEHLDEYKYTPTDGVEIFQLYRPGENEYRLNVEYEKQKGEDVVADVTLAPSTADRFDARLISDVLESPRRIRGDHLRHPNGPTDKQCTYDDEDCNGDVIAVVLIDHSEFPRASPGLSCGQREAILPVRVLHKQSIRTFLSECVARFHQRVSVRP